MVMIATVPSRKVAGCTGEGSRRKWAQEGRRAETVVAAPLAIGAPTKGRQTKSR